MMGALGLGIWFVAPLYAAFVAGYIVCRLLHWLLARVFQLLLGRPDTSNSVSSNVMRASCAIAGDSAGSGRQVMQTLRACQGCLRVDLNKCQSCSGFASGSASRLRPAQHQSIS
jgi:hypothetical protein